MKRAVQWLLTRSKTFLTAFGVFVVLLIAVGDYSTGYEMSVGVFYLLPVFLVSWGVGKKTGTLMSIFSAFLWFLADVGTGHPYSSPALPYWNASVRLGFFQVVAYLAWHLREAQEGEKQTARRDPLTGVSNRRAFLEIAERESRSTRRHECPLTMVYLDLDNFKAVNDLQGHSVGDELLQVVARALQEGVRDTDSVARLGGDEFAILLPRTGLAESKAMLERLRTRLLEAMRKNDWPVTFSIGSLTFSRPVSVDEMIKRADALMYTVKRKSKDAIHCELTQGKFFTQGVLTD